MLVVMDGQVFYYKNPLKKVLMTMKKYLCTQAEILLESKKSSIELESLGIIYSLNTFHLYILNNSFTIRTDCNNIVEFYKKNSFISKRWLYFFRSQNRQRI